MISPPLSFAIYRLAACIVCAEVHLGVSCSAAPLNGGMNIVPNRPYKAFEILVRRHHRRILGYAISISGNEDAAQDIVQDSFLVAWERLDDFDTSKDFGAWVRGIVRNKCREYSRASKHLVIADDVLESVESQHQLWDQREAETDQTVFSAMHTCLGKLPELLSQAVNLFYLQRLSGAEVAQRVGADEAAIRKRLQRARVALADCITNSVQA